MTRRAPTGTRRDARAPEQGELPLGSDPGSELTVYTDGACSGNPGPGGWAAVLVRQGRYEELGGREEQTTNNRMEMRAAAEGLRRAAAGDRVHVVTDSRYLHDGICRWIHGWKRKGWRKADGNEVLNRDLWEDLDVLVRRPGLAVTWEHVRGHAGHALNERCDAIATAYARGREPELRCGDGSWIPGLATDRAPVVEGAGEGAEGFPLYLSLVEGALATHATWAECEARVKGARGAHWKKARSPAEVRATRAQWGVVDA
ncbi:MAG: ribonuclease HI [Deltaproteobacteria bacterium]|nr:ribonuclease HI [Deltaproteobacteria bacterium]